MLSSILSAAILWSVASRAVEVTPCGTETTAFTKDCFTCQPFDYYRYGFLGLGWDYITKICFKNNADYISHEGYRCAYYGADYTIKNDYFTDRFNINKKYDKVEQPLVGECYYDYDGKLLSEVTVNLGKKVTRESWSRCPNKAPRNQKCFDRKLKLDQDEADAKYYTGDKIESDECQRCPKRSESNSANVQFAQNGTMACQYEDQAGKKFECDYNGATGKLTGSQNVNDCADKARAGTLLCLENKAARDEARRKEEEHNKYIQEEGRKAAERGKVGAALGILLSRIMRAGYCAYCEGHLDGKTKFLGLSPCVESYYNHLQCGANSSS